MLKALYNFCSGETCATTIAEDEAQLGKTWSPNTNLIVSYPQSHILYKKYSELINNQVDEFSSHLCRSDIDTTYIKHIQKSKIPIITLARKKDESGNIFYTGFAQSILEFTDDNYQVKIEVICTAEGNSGLGKAIINQVTSFVKYYVPTVDSVVVNSIPSAKGFYNKLGFTRIRNNNNITLKKKIGGKYSRKLRKYHKCSRKNRNM